MLFRCIKGSFFILFSVCICSSWTNSISSNFLKINQISSKYYSRDPRLFFNWFIPLPNFLPFLPTPPPPAPITPGQYCETDQGEEGQCLTVSQCNAVNGGMSTTKSCAPGGFCCLIKLTWDNPMKPGEITVTHTYSTLVNTEGKATRTTYFIPRVSSDTCQVKLEFKKFNLAQPDSSVDEATEGDCRIDSMIIMGADNLTPSLVVCGNLMHENSVEHLYLHYGSNSMISVSLNLRDSTSNYNIFVTMIKCGSAEAAPAGCTQYQTHAVGEVRSFNYPHQQLNNQHYSVCIQANSGAGSSQATSIKWSPCVGEVDPFFISGLNPMDHETNCAAQDRITIPGAKNSVFCGGIFLPVETKSKPFVLFVDFDEVEWTPVPDPVSPGDDKKCPPQFVCTAVTQEPPGDGTCSQNPQENICVLDLSNPSLNPSNIITDRANTGFCLQYSKA